MKHVAGMSIDQSDSPSAVLRFLQLRVQNSVTSQGTITNAIYCIYRKSHDLALDLEFTNKLPIGERARPQALPKISGQ